MFALINNLKSQFDASAAKIAAEEAAVTAFEKFHFITLDYRTPIIASILYVLVVSFFSKLNLERAAKSSSSSNGKRTSSRAKTAATAAAASGESESRFTPFKCLVIAHNVFLCIYSATVLLSALPLLVRPYFNYPVMEAVSQAYCYDSFLIFPFLVSLVVL